MRPPHPLVVRALGAATVLAAAFWAPLSLSGQEAGLRPMTFLDVQLMRSAGSFTPSPDGRWLLHTVSVPDWKEARSQTDIHLVSLSGGVSTSRQMTFTATHNETSPAWSRDGRFFAFLSNRDAGQNGGGNQLYVMRPDGGEALKVTSAQGGVSNYVFTRDGRWIVFRAGRSGEQQLYRIPVEGILDPATPPTAEKLTDHAGGVQSWEVAPDSRRIYFTGPDEVDRDDRLRRERRFTVNIRDQETPLHSLWVLELDPVRAVRLTEDPSYTVQGFNVSPDGRWVGYTGISSHRYHRNITEQGIHGDLYLLETATGHIERLTDNEECRRAGPTSPLTAASWPSWPPTT